MNCPTCGVPMRWEADHFVCLLCQKPTAPATTPTQNVEGVQILAASNQKCPHCDVPLQQATLAEFSILSCTQCRGMLVAMAIFPTLVQTLRAQQADTAVQPPPDPAALRRTIHCPHCRRPMEAHFYAGPGNIVLDSCEPCLLNWLDHDELTRIAQAPDSLHSNDDDTHVWLPDPPILL